MLYRQEFLLVTCQTDHTISVQSAVVLTTLQQKWNSSGAEHQSARMSKITNDGLTQSGTECFIAVPLWQQRASKKWCLNMPNPLTAREVSLTTLWNSSGATELTWIQQSWTGLTQFTRRNVWDRSNKNDWSSTLPRDARWRSKSQAVQQRIWQHYNQHTQHQNHFHSFSFKCQ